MLIGNTALDELLKSVCCSCRENENQCQIMRCSCRREELFCVTAYRVCGGHCSNGEAAIMNDDLSEEDEDI